MKFIYIYILLCMGLYASTSSTIVLTNDISVYQIDDKVSVFSDESKTLTLEEIKAQNLWEPLASLQREGFKKTTLWLKFCITNESTKNFFLYYNFPILANFEVFQETFNESEMHQMGSKFAQWDDGFGSPRFIVPLKLKPQEQTNIYIKLEHWGSIPLRLHVLDEKALLEKENHISLINGLFIGILILIVAYHFILYFITKYKFFFSLSIAAH